MNGSQLMGLDSVGTGIYAIHEYFRGLTVGQWTPGFLGCHMNDGMKLQDEWMVLISPYESYIRQNFYSYYL